jgi:ribosomal protein S18 acetylase RimI-like enzyme
MIAMPDSRSIIFSLRQALPDDRESVVHLMAEFCQHFSYPFNQVARRGAIAELLANTYLGSIWLIDFDSQLLGYVALTYGFTFEFGGRDAFIDEFYVSPNYRNLGIGKRALSMLQQKAGELGLVALHLQTESYNDRAQKLYNMVGFVDLNRNTLTWQTQDYQRPIEITKKSRQ